MLDPEQLTYAQWFWIVFVMVVVIMFACRCLELTDPEQPLTNEPMVPSSSQSPTPRAPGHLPAVPYSGVNGGGQR